MAGTMSIPLASFGILLIILSTLLSQSSAVLIPKKSQLCFHACETVLSSLTFNGSPSALDGFYEYRCQNPLLVKSKFLCAKAYCTSEKEWADGLDWAIRGCEVVGLSLLEPHTVDVIASANLTGVPPVEQGEVALLNNTAIPSQMFYNIAYKTLYHWYGARDTHFLYSEVMFFFWAFFLILGAITNFVKWARQLNYPVSSKRLEGVEAYRNRKGLFGSTWTALQTHVFLPATFAQKCDDPISIGTIPPRAETIVISIFVVLNFVLCGVSYHVFPGNLYYPDTSLQFWRYFSDRTGYLSYANLGIFWAFGIRNNILIWLTGWNFVTFNRFHRWVARVSTLQAVLHSVGYSIFALLEGGWAEFSHNFSLEYWYTGVIATVVMSLLMLFSIIWLRLRFYETFLLLHISLSLIMLVNLFYHTRIFGTQYDGFLWPCVGFWVFDRIWRVARVAYHAMKAPTIEAFVEYSAESSIVRLDVTKSLEHIRPPGGSYYFLYSPLSLFAWENHPFTLCRWKDGPSDSVPSSPSLSPQTEDDGKSLLDDRAPLISATANTTARYSFIIRPYKGYTSRLVRNWAGQTKPFLLEGPYSHAPDLKRFTEILLLAGGSGISVAITCIYDILEHNPNVRINLVWATRSSALMDNILTRELKYAMETGQVTVNAHVTRTRRLSTATEDLTNTLSSHRPSIPSIVHDAAAKNSGSLAVVACGPGSMMDDARAAFVKESCETKGDMKLFLEAFTW